MSGVPVVTPAELFDLSGTTAVVTGASSGLGRRAALVLAAAGANVVAGARRADRLAELAACDARIRPVECDISDERDRQRLVDAAGEQVDVLVNNAAVGGQTSSTDEDAAAFARVLDVNLVAAYDLARRAAERMPSGGGSVVNVASVLGMVSGAPLAGAAYASSKAGLIGLTRELAGQWARQGVRVNALAPGWFRTEMTEKLFADERSTGWVERGTMLRRAGDVHELDGALLFLASAASSYCTGQVLVVDGGWTAR